MLRRTAWCDSKSGRHFLRDQNSMQSLRKWRSFPESCHTITQIAKHCGKLQSSQDLQKATSDGMWGGSPSSSGTQWGVGEAYGNLGGGRSRSKDYGIHSASLMQSAQCCRKHQNSVAFEYLLSFPQCSRFRQATWCDSKSSHHFLSAALHSLNNCMIRITKCKV